MNKKFYAVYIGRKTGVFDNWDECKKQIFQYSGAKYRSFKDKEEALNSLKLKTLKKDKKKQNYSKELFKNSISVDAACSGNPGKMEYRGVDTITKEEVFKIGPFQDGTNNIGEFLAIVHALAMIKKKSINYSIIYTDSQVAIKWVKEKKCNSKLNKTRENIKIFNFINRAENWLLMNGFSTKIKKWETKMWGEIPADFGRK